MKQFTKEQAVALAKSGEWKDWTDEEIARFQLYQRRLCVPFKVFHRAVEKVLGRPVFTHEFGKWQNIIDEYEGERTAPTFEEIVNMIPEEKRILIGL